MFRMLAERQQSMSALVGWTSNTVITVEIDGVRARGNVSAVTGNYCTELGIRPVAGRLLTDADVSLGTQLSAPVAVIGHGFWQRQFATRSGGCRSHRSREGTTFTVVGLRRPVQGLGLTLESTWPCR